MPRAERQRQPLGQPQVQLRQSRPGFDVFVCPVFQGRLGQHHVPGSGCSWA